MKFILPAAMLLVSAWAADAADVIVPPDQRAFIELVLKYREAYRSAPNELKKSTLVDMRRDDLRKTFKSEKVDGWYAKLSKMGTTGDGHAWIVLTVDGYPFTMKTWNNRPADGKDRTLILKGTPLFAHVSEISVGAAVKFSADVLGEGSLTEAGAMLDPEWIVRIRAITQITAGQ